MFFSKCVVIKKQKVALFLTLFLFSFLAEAKDVVMHFYQQTPPFETAPKQGYLHDLVRYIDQNDSTHNYHLVFMPRELINRLIEKNLFQGIVVGANPAWFDDIKKTKYLWTTSIIEDANELISDLTYAFEYTGLKSLHGLTLGGIRGHYYVGIDPLVKQGIVYRDDVNRVTQNLRKATSGRVNVSVINRSFLQFYLLDHEQSFYISSQPYGVHEKQILFTQEHEAIHRLVNKILTKAKQKGDLEKLLDSYR